MPCVSSESKCRVKRISERLTYIRASQIPGTKSPGANILCMVPPNICVSSVWKLLHVVLVALRILKWLLRFFFLNCAPPDIHNYSVNSELLSILCK
jgi:hypothetical protein